MTSCAERTRAAGRGRHPGLAQGRGARSSRRHLRAGRPPRAEQGGRRAAARPGPVAVRSQHPLQRASPAAGLASSCASSTGNAAWSARRSRRRGSPIGSPPGRPAPASATPTSIVNPTHWDAWRDRLPALFDALAQGLAEAEQDGLATVNLCVSLLRQQTAQEAVELVDWILRDRPDRVVALSIDGNETAAGRTGARFAEAFTRARDGGLHRTVHAGESSGPEGVWDAIRYLHAERIDHGVRAIEDPELVAYLADSEHQPRRLPPVQPAPRPVQRPGRAPAGRAARGRRAGHRQHRRPGAARHPAGVGVGRLRGDLRLGPWPTCATSAAASIDACFAPEELKAALRAELGRDGGRSHERHPPRPAADHRGAGRHPRDAVGDRPADLIVRGGRVLHVHTGEFLAPATS